jgi:flagellar basal-body rod protein FlgF
MSSVSADIALSQQQVLMRDLHVTQHNIANSKAPGFQAESLIMVESPVRPTFNQSYAFVDDLVRIRDLTQGQFVDTGNPFHAYISGRAYFAVQTPQGIRYTRNGAFTLNPQSELVTAEGYQVLNPGNAPIVIPEGLTNISIGSDGVISSNQGQIDQLGAFSFQNEQLLKDVGDNLLTTTEQPALAENYSITQFGFEGSNVNEIRETTHLMDIMRKFQHIQKFIEQNGRMQSQATQSLLKISSFA